MYDEILPEVPGNDPTRFCRLCFAQTNIHWVIRTLGTEVDQPFIETIGECLGIWLRLDRDFPCAICRECTTKMEEIAIFRATCRQCDKALQRKRQEDPSALVMFYDVPAGRAFVNGSTVPNYIADDASEDTESDVEFISEVRMPRQRPSKLSAKDKKLALKNYMEMYAKWTKTKTLAGKEDDEITIDAPEALEEMEDNSDLDIIRVETAPAEDASFTCVKCGRHFPNLNSLKRHETLHGSKYLINCTRCSMQFTNVSNLEAHRKSDGCQPFRATRRKCAYCDRVFSCTGRYNFHLKRLHPNMLRKSTKGAIKPIDRRLPQKKTAPVERNGRYVVLLERLPKRFAPVTSAKQTNAAAKPSVICTMCFKRYKGLVDFDNHLVSCTRNHRVTKAPPPFEICECDACAQIINDKKRLLEHLERHYFPYRVKPHQCSDCQEQQTTQDDSMESALILGI